MISEPQKRTGFLKIAIDGYTLVDIVGFVYISYLLSGDTSSRYLYLASGLFLGWCLTALLSNIGVFQRALLDKKIGALLIHLIFAFISGIAGGTLLFSSKQVGATIILFSPILLFNYYYIIGDDKVAHALKLFLIPFIYYMIKAAIFYNANEGAARILARNRLAYGDLAIGGGYGLAYGCALLGVTIISIIACRRESQFRIKLIYSIIIVLCTLIVIQTRSSVTLVSYAICIAVAVIFRRVEGLQYQKSFSSRLGSLGVSLVLVILIFLNLSYIGRFLLQLSGSIDSIVGQRLASLAYAIIGEGDGGYAIGRLSLPFESFKVFLSHPLIGVAYLHGNGFISSAQFGVARHCEWADTLANYGLIGGLPYIYIYVKLVITLKKYKEIGKAWVLCLFLLGMFNPLRANQAHFVIFFVIPALCTLYRSKEQ